MPIDRIPLPDMVAGRLYATGFTDVGPDPDAALASVGADVLLCLLTDHDISLRYPDFLGWLERHTGGRAWRFRIDDGDVAEDDATATMALELADRLRAGQGVVTHCGAGIGRTSLACGLARAALADEDLAETLAIVRAARPGAGPENPLQRAHLERLAARLRGVRAMAG